MAAHRSNPWLPDYLPSHGESTGESSFRLPDLPRGETRVHPPSCLTTYLSMRLKELSLVSRLLDLSHGGARVDPSVYLTTYLLVRLKEDSLVYRQLGLSHGGVWVQPLATRLVLPSGGESIGRSNLRLPDLPHEETRIHPLSCLTTYLPVELKEASLVSRLLDLSHG